MDNGQSKKIKSFGEYLNSMTESGDHIGDKIKNSLISDGWVEKPVNTFKKKIKGYEASGSVSDGTRVVTLTLNDTYRWFSRVDGWGKAIKDIDLRDYSDHKKAIDAILKQK